MPRKTLFQTTKMIWKNIYVAENPKTFPSYTFSRITNSIFLQIEDWDITISVHFFQPWSYIKIFLHINIFKNISKKALLPLFVLKLINILIKYSNIWNWSWKKHHNNDTEIESTLGFEMKTNQCIIIEFVSFFNEKKIICYLIRSVSIMRGLCRHTIEIVQSDCAVYLRFNERHATNTTHYGLS